MTSPMRAADRASRRADTASVFRWLRAIAEDHSIPASGFRIAFLISQAVNSKTGTAWPSQEQLARWANLSVEAVRLAVVKLRQEGYLLVQAGGGRGKSTEYQLVHKPPTRLGGIADENPNSAWGINAESPHPAWGFSDENPQKIPAKPPKNPATNYKKNHLRETYISPPLFADEAKTAPRVADHEFDRFWTQYPRKVAKPAAQRAWRVALKKASASEIIAGALRYSAERHGQDPTYTKHPSTWLNGECWADEPAPNRAQPQRPTQKPTNEFGQMVDALFGDE